ncbi:MAG: right-handed parallel beta-helix repeat-containing protein [Oscillospiraceae bacterium]|nr:right-handed parallel beta-helix repeat-containing protein [Oscillospiraceae bacterium]
MKTKSTNRFVSMALALIMLLTCVSFGSLSFSAKAAGTPHTFESKSMEEVKDSGKWQNGDEVKYDDYFTLHMSASSKIDSSTKSWSDGYTSGQRLNFGGTPVVTGKARNVMSFKTSAAATVKVWYAFNKTDRMMTIWDAKTGDVYAEVKADSVTPNTTDGFYWETKVEKGEYYLGASPNSNYIFKVEVTEEDSEPVETKDYTITGEQLYTQLKDNVTESLAKITETVKSGTSNYFTIYWDKGRVNTDDEKNRVTFDDDYSSLYSFDFNGYTRTSDESGNNYPCRLIEFTAEDKGYIKIWWKAGGAGNGQEGANVGRYVQLYSKTDGKAVRITDAVTDKATSGCYVSTLTFSDAGTYYIGTPNGTCSFYKIVVTEGELPEIPRTDWKDIATPVITEAKDDGSGKIIVTVNADVSDLGGDSVTVTMKDSNGEKIASKSSSSSKKDNLHTFEFEPTDSGTYTFTAALSRKDDKDGNKFDDKVSADVNASFSLPLGTPTVVRVTSKGAGAIEIVWDEVKEADSYTIDVYKVSENARAIGGEFVKSIPGIKTTKYTVEGLDVGSNYIFRVAAVRGDETTFSEESEETTATPEAQTKWFYNYFGSGSSLGKNCGYEENENGTVTVWSENGGGKLNSSGADGLSAYYTTVSTSDHFTFRAKVHVDSAIYNSQSGFGLFALDHMPAKNANPGNTNEYFVAASKIEYYYNDEADEEYNMDKIGSSIKMHFGISAWYKHGYNTLAETSAGFATENIELYPLETSAKGKGTGTYNIVGNTTGLEASCERINELTDFIFEIVRNNTGYFLSYYTADGVLVSTKKFYDTEALSLTDPDNVYIGYFAARDARATFELIELNVIPADEDDSPVEERPIKKITPIVSIASATSSANTPNYELLFNANVAGTADIYRDGKLVVSGVSVDGSDDYTAVTVTLEQGYNSIEVIFYPDPDQTLPEYTTLASTEPVSKPFRIRYSTAYESLNNLYVSPNGLSTNNGTKASPLNIFTAIKVVQPGQKIILMEGTYKLYEQLLIERGMDGTAEAPIYMIADPDAKSRPVFDFQGKKGGIKLGGSYWYLKGFDVTNAGEKTPGFIVSGNNNILDDIVTHHNTDTGIYIKAYRDTNDPKSYWPKDNLILNCTSHNNCDSTMNDADGFAAKLTCGAGNVFDGCIAYNNIDDGWDLYTKPTSGPIGEVTIKNCVAYNNGFLEGDNGTGEGNGFKMGGENISVAHVIENCISFNNRGSGFTSNNNPAVTFKNCTSYNNTKNNINLVSGSVVSNTNWTVSGYIGFSDNGETGIDARDLKGTQVRADVENNTNYFWNGSKSLNTIGSSGVATAALSADVPEITADMFVSLNFKGSIARYEDGTINMEGFLELDDTKAPLDSGARFTRTMSETPPEIDIVPDPEIPESDSPSSSSSSSFNPGSNDPAPPTGVEFTFVIFTIVISAAAAIVFFKKRRSSK